MRKLTRFLACFLAALLVVSNVQYLGVVKAAEAEETILAEEGEEATEGSEEATEGSEEATEGSEDTSEGSEDTTEGSEESTEESTEEATEESTEEVADVDSITYTFANIQYDSKGPEVKVNEDGSATIKATGNYSSVFLTIPEEVAAREIQKITFNVTSENAGNFAYKVFMAEGFADAMWGSGITVTDENQWAIYGNPVQEIPADYQNGLGYMAVMSSFAEGSGIEEDTIEISDITFDCTPIKPVEKTYSFAELTYDSKGPEVKVNEDGSASIKATGNYASVFITIPEEVAAGEIQKITFNVTSENAGNFAYKVFLAEGFADAMWGSGITVTDENQWAIYGNPVQVIPEDYQAGLGYMAVMSSFADGSGIEEDTIEISGITFTYLKNSNKPQITYGDNIILNPNFAEEDLSVWEMGTTKATISSAEAEEAIFDDVTTYGIIDRDPEASWETEGGLQDARHEFFAQDITAAIEADGDLNRKPKYKVEFWAMLSDDYKDAPADQRVVEFAPYIVTEQDGPVFLGASYSTQLSGKLSQTLTVGEWTKYEGTFEVAHDGTIKQVVIRVVEQGTEYGDINKGSCVKGDYYVTGFSMKEVVEPETTIEENIPNWKDAITDAFGDDAIAGTCLGSGTITMENLQALAKKHFNAITFENEMKPDITLGSTPKFDEETGELVYNFNVADRMMAKIKEWNDADPDDDINFKIRGHVLVWHSQTPEWFFHENYNVDEPFLSGEKGIAEMNARLEHYIAAVFNHYNNVKFEDGTTAADMFYGWDVVNEAMSDNTGKPRKASDNSNWARVYGDESNEYIINAFRYANKYAPEHIRLYYNDYNDSNEPKAGGIAELLDAITKAENDAVNPTRIDGMGMQAHHNYSDPSVGQIKSAINKYLAALGKGGVVEMTEFDVKASSSYNGTAASLKLEHSKQAWRFKEIFDAYKEIEEANPGSVGGITMWGVVDERSWLQSSNSVGGASTGGTHAPLLFYTENYVSKAKPAFYAFFDEYLDTLEPMIQDVTVMQQMEEDNFDIGYSYNVAGTADFIPMWTEDGLVIKVSVQDATDDGEKDIVTIYVDEENSKAEGDYKAVVINRAAEDVTSTAEGYEAIVKIPMETASAKIVGFDVVVENNGVASVFNDKKNIYAESSKYYAEAIMKPFAVIQRGTIEVDAEYDETWDKVDAIPLTIKLGANADASMKALWDSEYLYVYAEVKDAVLDDTSAQVHEKDSIEVFIDENNAKADSYEADDKQYRINYKNEQSFNGSKCLPENITSATKLTEEGYIVEAAIAWTDIRPQKGMKIGLEFQINDGEGGTRLGTASWYDTSGNGWSSPSVLGTVLLDESGFAIDDIADQVYTGKAIIPEVNVYHNINKLVAGKDYTVKAVDNVKVGTAKATVTGKGNYSGITKDIEFAIVAKDINAEDVVANNLSAVVKKDGSVNNPKVTIKYGSLTLKENTDYTLVWPEIKDADGKVVPGTYVVKAEAVENSNYTGSMDIAYTIYANTDVAMSKVSVKVTEKVAYADFVNGKVPAITVKYNKEDLVTANKVEVIWPDEVAVGKNNVVTVKGLEGFYGEKTAKFEVTGVKLTAADFEVSGIADVVYTGDAIEFAELAVKDVRAEEAVALVEGKDYEVAYANNINVGKATVTIKGINGFTGTLKKTFKINVLDITAEGTAVSASIAAQTYTGKKIVPAATVVVNSKELTNKDYTVKAVDNVKVGLAKATITLKGNYKGTLEVPFAIVAKSLADADITVNGPFVVTIKKGAVKDPTVTVKMGKTTLKANTDYKVTMPELAKNEEDKVVAGDYTIAIAAVEGSNFAGSIEVPYKVLAENTVQMSKVSVKAGKVAYFDYLAGTMPAVTVKYGKTNLLAEDAVKVDVKYPTSIAVGKNEIVVTAKEDSGFYGTKVVKFDVTGVKLVNKATSFEITGIEKSYIYTGENIKPLVVIKDVKRGVTLVEGVDYTVTYTNNKKVGKKAKVTITGMGGYTGKITKTFEIKKAEMTFADKVASIINSIF